MIKTYGKFNGNAAGTSDGTQHARSDDGPQRDKQARRGESSRVRGGASAPHAQARVEEKQTDNASDRTPSGSVRSEAARQDAPRNAGGAARPDASDHGGQVVDSEENCDIPLGMDPKEFIRKVNANSSLRTGRNGLASRAPWLPDRSPSKHESNIQRMDKILGGEPEDG